LLLYSHIISSRLQYITDFIGKEILNTSIHIISDKEAFKQSTEPKLNYSNEKISENEYFIKPHSLLFENNIKQQSIVCFDSNGQRAFFETEGDFPFDIFAASFYLLSRYEEYLPHQKDMYGRYAHENSLAFKEGFLHSPLINFWLNEFKGSLKQKFAYLELRTLNFELLLTYDIDEAFAYKNKTLRRTVGGFVKDVLKGQRSKIIERIQVLRGKKKDPYDSFEWIDDLHRRYNLKPLYFFLVAPRNVEYDKNILPKEKAVVKKLVPQKDEIIKGKVINEEPVTTKDKAVLEKKMSDVSLNNVVSKNDKRTKKMNYKLFSRAPLERKYLEKEFKLEQLKIGEPGKIVPEDSL